MARMGNKFKRTTSDRMRSFGDIDLEKRHIRINKKKSKSPEGKKQGGVLDTIVHEETHRKHPEMHEKTVRKETKKAIKGMGSKEKAKHFSRFR